MSISTFAVLIADASATGYANKYREKASIAVIVFSNPPLGSRWGRITICMASSGPISHSGGFRSSGVIVEFGTLLSCAHT